MAKIECSSLPGRYMCTVHQESRVLHMEDPRVFLLSWTHSVTLALGTHCSMPGRYKCFCNSSREWSSLLKDPSVLLFCWAHCCSGSALFPACKVQVYSQSRLSGVPCLVGRSVLLVHWTHPVTLFLVRTVPCLKGTAACEKHGAVQPTKSFTKTSCDHVTWPCDLTLDPRMA